MEIFGKNERGELGGKEKRRKGHRVVFFFLFFSILRLNLNDKNSSKQKKNSRPNIPGKPPIDLSPIRDPA